MKTSLRTLAVIAVVAGGTMAAGTSRVHAQAFGFSYAQPGLGISVGTGPYGGVFPGYPGVVPAPVVAPVAPVVAPVVPLVVPPVVVARPLVVARPFYGVPYYGGYRPYPHHYYRR
jgi:hypothetical protein